MADNAAFETKLITAIEVVKNATQNIGASCMTKLTHLLNFKNVFH
jgi:hypothetical protein